MTIPKTTSWFRKPRQGRPGSGSALCCRLVAWLAVAWSLSLIAPASGQGATVAAESPDSSLQGMTNDNSAPDVAAEAVGGNSNSSTATTASGRHGGLRQNAVVVFFQDVELKATDSADAVVVIGGSAKIRGQVKDAVVVIGGDANIEGEVGDAVVAVLGSVRAGEKARIRGDVVAVGGKIDVVEGASIRGHAQAVDPGLHLAGLRSWLFQCVFKLRPLAPQVGWVWLIWGAFLLLYLLVTLMFPRPVQACVTELTTRPATTFLVGLLTKVLVPVVLVILTITGIGVLVVPFVVAALVLGGIVGKAAILGALGLQVGRQFGARGILTPLAGLLIGAVIITCLYLVPILGLLTLGILSVWGLGAVVTASFGGLRREMPARPGAPLATAIDPVAPAAFSPAAAPFDGAPEGVSSAPRLAAPASAVPPAAGPEAMVYPRAGFWQRMAAGLLDVVMIGLAVQLAHGVLSGWLSGALRHAAHGMLFHLLIALAYFAGMWAWKGTTVGGIVLGLKVVRLDGRPVTFTVALVRGLAAAFSVVVLFLGMLWIAWDAEKQGWHDRIAGTVVVRLPKGTPLVCL